MEEKEQAAITNTERVGKCSHQRHSTGSPVPNRCEPHIWTGAPAFDSTSLATGSLLASLKDNAHPWLSATSHGSVVRERGLFSPETSTTWSNPSPGGSSTLASSPLAPVPKEGDASRQEAFRWLLPWAAPGQACEVGWARQSQQCCSCGCHLVPGQLQEEAADRRLPGGSACWHGVIWCHLGRGRKMSP